MKLKAGVREYLRQIGAKGGSKSKRSITPKQQAKMQKARTKKRLNK
jgi:hypothetical protein